MSRIALDLFKHSLDHSARAIQHYTHGAKPHYPQYGVRSPTNVELNPPSESSFFRCPASCIHVSQWMRSIRRKVTYLELYVSMDMNEPIHIALRLIIAVLVQQPCEFVFCTV